MTQGGSSFLGTGWGSQDSAYSASSSFSSSTFVWCDDDMIDVKRSWFLTFVMNIMILSWGRWIPRLFRWWWWWCDTSWLLCAHKVFILFDIKQDREICYKMNINVKINIHTLKSFFIHYQMYFCLKTLKHFQLRAHAVSWRHGGELSLFCWWLLFIIPNTKMYCDKAWNTSIVPKIFILWSSFGKSCEPCTGGKISRSGHFFW